MQYIDTFDPVEIRDILAAFAILSAALFLVFDRWGIVASFVPFGASSSEYYAIVAGVAVLSVLTGFLAHELSHRYYAHRLGGFARFRIWVAGAVFALMTSLFGFLFAAPGAVYISGVYDTRGNGRVSLAGPAANMVAAALLYATAAALSPYTIYAGLFGIIGGLNSWYAVFNMLPIPPLDGSKVLAWEPRIFAFAMILAIGLNIPAVLFYHFF